MEKKQMIKKALYLVVLCFLLTSCCHTRKKTMDHMEFAKIQDGSSFKLVTQKFGPPYDVMLLKSGIKEYRYLKLTELAPGVTEQVHFIITVSYDGLIINTKAETIMATAELYNPDGPDYLLVEPDSLPAEFCGEKEINCDIPIDWNVRPDLFVQ